MLQLIYLSTATPAWTSSLKDLCKQAAENNERREITGIILHQNGSFLQVLEGPKATVEDTFLRIIADPRHEALALLSRETRSFRQFGDWSMTSPDSAQERSEMIDRVRQMIVSAPEHLRADFETRLGETA